LYFKIRTRGEKKWFRERVFAKFVLVGWAAGGPPNSGRREYHYNAVIKLRAATRC
jgi:hypothetical protein